MISDIFSYINGRKTYIIGTATIIYALLGLFLGHLAQDVATEMIFMGLGLMGVRHAISKMEDR